jgi:Zn-finger protein
MEKSRVNHRCYYYPCHDEDKLKDCTFCYCPLYPCNIDERGKYLENGVWDCSTCTWPHEKERVDKIFEFLNKNWIRK